MAEEAETCRTLNYVCVCVCVSVCEKYNVSLPKRAFLMLSADQISTTGNRMTLDRRRLPI
jgi:hypothetical protein